MIYDVIKLKEIFPQLRGNYEPTLTAYCPDKLPDSRMTSPRASIVILPGGGYCFTSDREAEPVAMQFMAQGYNAFILRYSVRPERYPESLLETAATFALVRRRAAEWSADPDRIAVLGFSAGGHLAASLGVFWKEPFMAQVLGLESETFRPNAMILGYPVITSGEFAHRDSFEELLGPSVRPELLEKMSLEKQVNDSTPPAFLWHTFEDEAVPVENSLFFASALRRHKIPFEMHIFPGGCHGLSLCNEQTSVSDRQLNSHDAVWMELCLRWLRMIF